MMKRLLFMLAFLVSFGFAAVGQESVDPDNQNDSNNNTEQEDNSPSESNSFAFENGKATVIMDGTKTLAELVTGYENDIEQIEIQGSIRSEDFSTMNQDIVNLHTIDLSQVTHIENFAEYNDPREPFIPLNAFQNNTKLRSIYFPACLETIEGCAFQGCILLNTVKFAENSSITRIMDHAFNGCSQLKVLNLSHCVKLQSIAYSAFDNCTKLQSVNLSNCTELSTIDYRAFYNCQALQTVDLSNCTKLSEIGSEAFRYTSIKSIETINCSSLTTIGSYAFYSYNDNDSFTFDFTNLSSLLTIEEGAFGGARFPETIKFNKTIKSIRKNAFSQCSMTNLDFSNTDIEFIEESAFRDCWNLTTVDFTGCNNLRAITPTSFSYHLESVTIDNTWYKSVDGIVYSKDMTTLYLYPSGKKLQAFQIPESVTTLKTSSILIYNTYDIISPLTHIYIPASVTDIEYNTFSTSAWEFYNNNLSIHMESPTPVILSGDIGLENCVIYVPKGSGSAYRNAPYWESYRIIETNAEMITITLENENTLQTKIEALELTENDIQNLKIIGPLGSSDFSFIKTMPILDVLDLSEAVFYNNRLASEAFTDTKIRKITLPKDIEEIGFSAFRGCHLEELNLATLTHLKRIESNAFCDCTGFPKTLELPNSVEFIGYGAFWETGIESVDFSNTHLTKIDANAFWGCRIIGELRFPPTLTNLGNGAFEQAEPTSIILQTPSLIKAGGYSEGMNPLFPEVFTNLDKSTCTLYVPKGLKDAYKSDSYWSLFPYIEEFGVIVSTSVNNDSWGHQVTSGGIYQTGDNVILQATPVEDFWGDWNQKQIHFFVGWFENGELVSSEREYTFTVGESDRNLQAIFEDIIINIDYPIYEIIQVEKNSTSITLDINRVSENYDYIFTGWYENDRCISDNKQVTINIDPTGNTSSRTIEAKLSFGSGSLGNTVIDDNNKINGQTLFIYDGVTVEGDLTWKPERINLSWSKSSLVVNSPIQANEIRLAAEDSDLAQERITDWLFISFPYDLKVNEIDAEGNLFVVRYYDGEKRALEGPTSSWKQLGKDETMKANQGYIFKTNASSNRSAASFNTDVSSMSALFNRSAVTIPLQKHESVAMPDANWNLIGNPFPCYFRTKSLFEEGGLDGTITVWDSNIQNYQYYTQDDDAYIAPLTAFFVQHNQATSVTFHPEGRAAKLPEGTTRSASALRRGDGRQVLNLVLSNDSLSDKTRIVFNEAAKAGYELGLDASKFRSMNPNAPAFYSIDADNQQLAINERPWDNGVVRLGCNFGVKGEYSIALQEAVEQDLILVDKVTGAQTNLKEQAYRFSAEVGESNDRFELRSGNPTGTEQISGFQWQVRGGQLFLTGLPTNARVIVHDTMGRTVCDRTVSDELSGLALPQAGVYYLTIRTQQATRTERIMVKE